LSGTALEIDNPKGRPDTDERKIIEIIIFSIRLFQLIEPFYF